MNRLRFVAITIFLSFFGLILILWLGLQRNPATVPSPLIGKSIPNFRSQSLFDPNIIIDDQTIKGRPALINVWASWCANCQIEHPVLLELAKQNVIILYGLNYKDTKEGALLWLDSFGNPYQDVIFDAQGKIGLDFGVYGVPETFLIDQNGVVVYKHTGVIGWDMIAEVILPFLHEPSI